MLCVVEHFLFQCSQWASARQVMINQLDTILGANWRSNDPNTQLLRVLGLYPQSLEAVGLDRPTSKWEETQGLKKGWIRARAPLWEFLVTVIPLRRKIIGPMIKKPEASPSDNSASRGAPGPCPQFRGNAPRVGQVLTCHHRHRWHPP